MSKISVLIPTYNRPNLLIQSLESVLNQSKIPNEIIISDDNINSDENYILIKPYLDKYSFIKYYKNEKNIGASANYKKLFDLANYDYIKWLADDDLLLPTSLEKMSLYLDKYPEVGIVTSLRTAKTENLERILEAKNLEALYKEDTIIDGKEFAIKSLVNLVNYIGEFSTVLFRKNIIKDDLFELEERTFIANSDWLLWLKILSKSKIVYISESLSIFRISYSMEQMNFDIQITGLFELTDFVFGNYFSNLFILTEIEKEKQIAKLVSYIRYNIDNSINKSIEFRKSIFNFLDYFTPKFESFINNTIENSEFQDNLIYVNTLLLSSLKKLKDTFYESDFINNIENYNKYFLSNKIELAEKELDQVIKIYDRNNDLLYKLAICKMNLDKFEEASEIFYTLIEREYQNNQLYLHVGKCLEKMGDIETSKHFFEIYNNS